MTRQELEERIDALIREYYENPEITEQVLESGQAASGVGSLIGPRGNTPRLLSSTHGESEKAQV